jgi:hypothetical protein
MKKVMGGVSRDRILFSEAARKVFDVAIPHRRLMIKLSNNAMRGMRFNSDGAILARLESMFTEEEFMGCIGLRIDAALIDAAQSDHWYEHEVRYDNESYFEDDTQGDEDESE